MLGDSRGGSCRQQREEVRLSGPPEAGEMASWKDVTGIEIGEMRQR